MSSAIQDASGSSGSTDVNGFPLGNYAIALGYLVPFTITYLVHVPNTRNIRIALYPIGLIAMVYVILRSGRVLFPKGTAGHDARDSSNAIGSQMNLYSTLILANVGASTRYAFARSPPVSHPLPRKPFFPRLRSTNAFKSLDLLTNEYRHINIVPSPPLRTSQRSYIAGIRYHLTWMYVHFAILDLNSYIPYRLAPNTLGSYQLVGGNFRQWCRDLQVQTGIPLTLIWIFWTINLAFTTYQGMACAWHILALLGVATGVYRDEEWVKIMDKPWLSTSLNELWGRRYHQTMKDLFLLPATPFRQLGRPIHVLAVFLFSALFHATIYYPLHNEFALWPYLSFFLACGLGCIAERQFYRITGKRVGGFAGVIWTWVFCLVVSAPIVEYEWSNGWAGAMRGELGARPMLSPVMWAVYALGLGPRPA